MAGKKRARGGTPDLVLSVGGYKSIANPIDLAIKPLTIIAGTNSSGKSSFVQPFLLLKQTIDAAFDAGPLLLHGPNVRLTKWEQAISRGKSRNAKRPDMRIGVKSASESVTNNYEWTAAKGIRLTESVYVDGEQTMTFRTSMSTSEVRANLSSNDKEFVQMVSESQPSRSMELTCRVEEHHGFLHPEVVTRQGRNGGSTRHPLLYSGGYSDPFVELIASIMHVPGLRGNPERSYISSALGGVFAGTMEKYVASLLDSWQKGNKDEREKLQKVASDLEDLGLTWKVTAQRLDDVQLELLVGRLPHAQQGGAHDLVNIADVGFGVSQTLPVIVALHAARPGQIVYIEQPEIHLHPRAQGGIARALVAAALRGVRVVIETHSSLVLRAIQTAVARGEISPRLISLNWFSRDSTTGHSQVDVAEMDERGRLGDWPLDFDDVAEQADWDYLVSAETE